SNSGLCGPRYFTRVKMNLESLKSFDSMRTEAEAFGLHSPYRATNCGDGTELPINYTTTRAWQMFHRAQILLHSQRTEQATCGSARRRRDFSSTQTESFDVLDRRTAYPKVGSSVCW